LFKISQTLQLNKIINKSK